jgi:hypothetical protein
MISQFGKGAHGAGELRPRVQSLGVATFVENKKIPSPVSCSKALDKRRHSPGRPEDRVWPG